MMQCSLYYVGPLIWLVLFASAPYPSLSMQNTNYSTSPSTGQEFFSAGGTQSTIRNTGFLSSFQDLSWNNIRSAMFHFIDDIFNLDQQALLNVLRTGTAAEVETILEKLKGPDFTTSFINRITVEMEIFVTGELESETASCAHLLHVAVLKEEFDVAEVLLRHGADIDSRDKLQRTPLHLAIRFQQHVDRLLEEGADPDLADSSGKTALHYAVICDSSLESILARSKNIDAVDSRGKTPLFYATNSRAVYLLMEHGADILFRLHSNGMTALHRACVYNIASPEQLRRAQAVVTVFKLALGDNVNILDDEGHTPLHYAQDSFMKGYMYDDESEEKRADAISVILQADVDEIRRGSVPVAYSPWWKGFECSSLQSHSTDINGLFIEQLPDLNCPILGEFPIDPVLASDGHTYDFKSLLMYLSERVKENLPVESPMTRLNLQVRVFPNDLSTFVNELEEMLNHPETEWKDWVMMWHEEMPFLCPDARHYSQKTIPVGFETSDSCYPNRALRSLANHAFEKLSARH